MTLVQLQNESGVSNSYLSQVENNQFKPSNDVLEKISKPLNVSLLHLMIASGDIPESTYKEYWDAESKKVEYELNLKQTLQKSFKSMTDMAYFNSVYYIENNNDANNKIETELKKIESQLNTVIKKVEKQIVIDNLKDDDFKALLLFIDSFLNEKNINEKRKTVYYFLKHRDNITKVFDKYLESLTPLDFMKDKELENYSDLHNQNLASTKHKQLKYPDIKDCLIKQTVYYDGKLLDEKNKSLLIKIMDALFEKLEVNYSSDKEIRQKVDLIDQKNKDK